MHIEYLVGMANDIGAFFSSEDSEALAASSIHAHLKRYWDPRMQAQIIAHYNGTGGEGLAGAVLAAVRQLAEEKAAKA